ncbi:calcium-binding protein [Microcoleus asticus]|uniref:Leukotoxin n=1 Tax=Microcoleus asticus IPMA8 TaxID=2563858 RepID=A0ABX2D151_9CYAN|nr:calcium-binding protein [Microcoleus asticus]NQE36374.1 Leukotoxin [Microcoleus asticus IPMA8]
MALQTDPSGVPRLIGDNTSEYADLFVLNSKFGGVTNFPSGVWMLGGEDTVIGSTIGDLVFGNDGEDFLVGDFGNDSLFGGQGKDVLYGNEGNDCLTGGQDADWMLDDAGNDILLGGRGNDLLFSDDGNDTLIGGLGRDFLVGANEQNLGSVEIRESNLYVIQAEPGVTDINNADLIAGFTLGADRIGLANGLTANDIVLENVTNVSITIHAEFPQYLASFATPDLLEPTSIVTSGTLIKVKNSGDLIGFVESVTPAQLQNSMISVQGF